MRGKLGDRKCPQCQQELEKMVVTRDHLAAYEDFGVYGDVCGKARQQPYSLAAHGIP